MIVLLCLPWCFAEVIVVDDATPPGYTNESETTTEAIKKSDFDKLVTITEETKRQRELTERIVDHALALYNASEQREKDAEAYLQNWTSVTGGVVQMMDDLQLQNEKLRKTTQTQQTQLLKQQSSIERVTWMFPLITIALMLVTAYLVHKIHWLLRGHRVYHFVRWLRGKWPFVVRAPEPEEDHSMLSYAGVLLLGLAVLMVLWVFWWALGVIVEAFL